MLVLLTGIATNAISQERPLDWKFKTESIPLEEDKENGLAFYGLEQGARAAFRNVDGVKGVVVVLPGERMNEDDRKQKISAGIDPDRFLSAIAVALVLPMADPSEFFVSKEDWNGLYVFRWKTRGGAEACSSPLPLQPYSDNQDVLFVWPCSFKPDSGVLIVTRNGENSIRGYGDYIPRTLRQIIKENTSPKNMGAKDGSAILTGETFSSRIKAVYSGQSRKILPEKKQHLDMLVSTFGVNQSVIDKYETEILFREGDVDYWLPTNSALIPAFEKEVKNGEQITLYAEWVGAKKIKGKWEWVFMVHEFHKP